MPDINDKNKPQARQTQSASGRSRAVSAQSADRKTPARGPNAQSPKSKRALAKWVPWLGLAVVVLVIGGFWLHARPRAAGAPETAASAAEPGTHYASQGHQGHAPGDEVRYAHFQYSSDPPTSGYHREILTTTFSSPTALPKYIQVHLLEHGNVLLQYSCFCPDVVKRLNAIAAQFDNRLRPGAGDIGARPADVQSAEEQGLAVVVAPYPSMKATIALTAWTRLATLKAVDDANIMAFINAYLHNEQNLNQ